MKISLALVTTVSTGLLLVCGLASTVLGGSVTLPGLCDVSPSAASSPATASAGPPTTSSAPAPPASSPACPVGAWTQPVHASVVSGFRTRSRPTHNGVDLGATRFTPIRAASAGVVIVARCDASTGDCDHDGSPTVPGCGWFVDIQHSGGVITRYCHMASRPAIGVGDVVTTGQIIGIVGSSGHSSGPHLHYEVHLNRDRSSSGAINPVAFMQAVEAPLE
ncbi:M23 family metallopeptidase [Hamadaea sp. NPDC051192]|uniref:M23 family metallopeptidase n=1 Tax=Hamadaea sp. NPDC051192 TaxID=3154940 RepID=UPI0034389AAD